MSDKLEHLARVAESEEKAEEALYSSEPQSEPEQAVSGDTDRLEAAGNLAATVLSIGGGAVKLFLDDRIELPESDIEAGRAALAPVIEKHNLVGEGSGTVPYIEEISAGMFLGSLVKKLIRVKRELRQDDDKDKEQERRVSYGEERKFTATDQTHAVSSEKRVREKSDTTAEGWNSEAGG